MLSRLVSYMQVHLLPQLPSYTLLISMVEAVALVALFIALQHLRRQVRRYATTPVAAAAEMRSLVQESANPEPATGRPISRAGTGCRARKRKPAEAGSRTPRRRLTRDGGTRAGALFERERAGRGTGTRHGSAGLYPPAEPTRATRSAS